MSDLVRVGVVGLGWFGRTHLDAWSACRGAEVVGVCDRDPLALDPVRARAQERFHRDAGAERTSLPSDLPRFGSLEQLLEAGIDLLDVVVSEDEHEPCVRAGLASGVDVLVEKPLALTLDAAEDLVGLARRFDRRLFVGQVLRFDARHIALWEAAQGRDLRHLSLARAFQVSAHDVYGRTHPVLNAAVHDIDLAIWLTGRAPERVSAFASHFLGREHPDCLDLVLEWDGGLRAVVQNGWHLTPSCPYGFTFDCVVQASDATFTLRNEPVLQAWTETVQYPEIFLWPRYAGIRAGALVAELQHVADCVHRGEASERMPLAQVLNVMATCQAAIDALEAGTSQAPRRVVASG